MSSHEFTRRNGTAIVIAIGLMPFSVSWVFAQVAPNGVLDPEAEEVLDLDSSGLPDILDGRDGIKGAAFFRLDGLRAADIEGTFPNSGPDGFSDAGYSDIPTGCKVCMDDRLIVRSAVNTGKLTVVYLADTDGIIGQCDAAASNTGDPCTKDADCPGGTCATNLGADDSLLYVGFDIFNGDPRVVGLGTGTCSPDADLSGSCVADLQCQNQPVGVGTCEGLDEQFHPVDFVDWLKDGDVCNDGVADFDNNGSPDFIGVPFDVDANGNPFTATRWDFQPGDPCQPDDVAELDLSDEQYRLLLYLCPPSLEILDGDENAQLPANIGQLFIEALNGEGTVSSGKSSNLVLPSGTVLENFFSSYPNDGLDVTAVTGDVEFLVEHVDSLIHAQCGRPGFPAVDCAGDFALDRFQFAQGGVRTMSDADADGSDEDFITATWFAPIPEIEVTKEVRCVGETTWKKTEEVMAGSTVEFKIEVENTGNVDLAVCLEDVLEGLGPASVTPVDDSLRMTLFRPSDGAATPVDFDSALGFGLNPDFFGDPLIPADQGFLDDLDGTCSYLGVLHGVSVCDDPADPVLGDRVVITFQATVDATFDSCCDPAPTALDVRNRVTAIGDPDIPPGDELLPPDNDETEDVYGVTVNDPANGVDTRRETIQGFDDNVVTIDLKCRDVEFSKTATARDDSGSPLEITGLPLADTGQFPVYVDYAYTLVNNGELTESVTITEKFLCGDVAAVADVSFDGCPICPGGAGGTADPCGGTVSETCTVKFDTPAALDTFLKRDDSGRPTCTANNPIDVANPLCYKNCANATVHADGLPEECNEDAAYSDDETICATDCQIQVTKGVKCADDVDYVDRVETLPGEVVNFRMTVENTGGSAHTSIALTDTFDCEDWVAAGTFDVKVFDDSGSEVAWPFSSPQPTDFENWFNGGGGRACFPFVDPLPPDWMLVFTFDVLVPEGYSTIGVDPECTNCLKAEGYIESTTCEPDLEPDDPCYDEACAEVNVLVPDMNCEKTVCEVDETGDELQCSEGPACVKIEAERSEEPGTYPLWFKYTYKAFNKSSELPLDGVTICDLELVTDAAAGDPLLDVHLDGCDLDPTTGCVDVGTIAAGDESAEFTCTILVPSFEAWQRFAALDGGGDLIYSNTATTTGTPAPEPDVCDSGHELTDTCSACVVMNTVTRCPCTKANFTIWNEWEVKFSGTHRCICDWDQALISEYDPPNHMLIEYLHTNKGKARIDGIASQVVCGEDSSPAPLIGVAAKLINFFVGTQSLPQAMAGMPMVGMGLQLGEYAGKITYDPSPAPAAAGTAVGDRETIHRDTSRSLSPIKIERQREGAVGGTASAAAVCEDLAPLTSQKGSIVVYPKLEVKWDAAGSVLQDTFVTLTNDFNEDVTIQMYLILDCETWVDNTILLTMNEPAYWSSINGAPKGAVSFGSLMPFAVPDPDPFNPGGSMLRGYLIAWAINPITGSEIHWNHLAGTATLVNYQRGYAWEYPAWQFRAVSADAPADDPEGFILGSPGVLELNGVEYDAAPDLLLLDFYASGTRVTSGGLEVVPILQIDTDLTFWPAIKDLRQP